MPSAPDSTQSETDRAEEQEAPRASLTEIAVVFLRLGSTAFGGPAAHIALMEEELVRRKKWIAREQFIDMLGAANLIPGPNSTEMAIHVGYKMGGLRGLIIAGICFILPAFLMVCSVAPLYVQYEKLPATAALLYGLKPVIVAIVLHAIWLLAETSLKTTALKTTAVAAAALYLNGVNEILLLFGCGLSASIFHFAKSSQAKEGRTLTVLIAASVALLASAYFLSMYTPKNTAYSLSALFLYFVKLGSVLYGSGYVLLAFLQSDLVENYHWITSAQLLDAVAVGQMTPGPLFTTATFVGFLLAGPAGAIVATIGIFLPAFIFVAFTAPLIKKMRDSTLAGQFLDAINAAAIAIIVGVLYHLAQVSLIDPPTLAIFLFSTILLLRFKINSLWLMLGGGIFGYILATGKY